MTVQQTVGRSLSLGVGSLTGTWSKKFRSSARCLPCANRADALLGLENSGARLVPQNAAMFSVASLGSVGSLYRLCHSRGMPDFAFTDGLTWNSKLSTGHDLQGIDPRPLPLAQCLEETNGEAAMK